MPPHILLTIDVEDWFQVENLKSAVSFESWSTRELRVERNTHKLLDLFDEISGQLDGQRLTVNGELKKVRATFFFLGWLAERLSNLVREIAGRGHEIASHGYGHELCSQCSMGDLKEDLAKSKKLLEDIIGDQVYGYRAPSFSISDDILKMIADAGYEYDSSYNSFAIHGRYGKISLNGHERSGIAILLNQRSTIANQKFYELPISNLPLFSFPILGPLAHFKPFRHFTLPWGGGAYFRLIPGLVFRIGVKKILRQQQAYLFYMHPWEVDPEQPRPEGTTAFSRVKHYTNLSTTEAKLRRLLEKFRNCSFVSCHEYLQHK